MMKRSLTTLVCLLVSSVVMSQTMVLQGKKDGSKEWYYLNTSGGLVLEKGYEKGYTFSPDGFAPVFDPESKSFYFIDLKGKTLNTEVTGFRLKEFFGMDITGFEDGMVPIKKDGLWGCLNTAGKLAVPLKYTGITEYNGGFAVAEIGKSFFIIDRGGHETAIKDPAILTVRKFSEGLAPFAGPDKMSGFINTSGEIVISARFQSVGYFQNGLAWAKTTDKKVGFINQKGEWAIQPVFLTAGEFEKESGLCRVKNADNTWCFINRKGGKVLDLDAESFSDFSEGLAYAKKDGKVGFIDNTGTWVIKPVYEAVRDFHNGFACAKQNGLWGLINRQGEWAIQPTCVQIRDVVRVN